MTSVLDASFWEKQFAVTDGDVERLHSYLCECEEPQEAIHLLERVVNHKIVQLSKGHEICWLGDRTFRSGSSVKPIAIRT
jgi:hypothetical protein